MSDNFMKEEDSNAVLTLVLLLYFAKRRQFIHSLWLWVLEALFSLQTNFYLYNEATKKLLELAKKESVQTR